MLLLEPLSVMGPSRHADRLPAYFGAQIAFHGVLTGLLAVLALVSGLICTSSRRAACWLER